MRGRPKVLELAFGAVLLIPLLVPAVAVAGDWEIERVANGKRFGAMTDRSLRLDAAGNPHVAYGGDHLYYAWYDGTTWHHEVADGSDSVGNHATLALDGAGHPHVAYYDSQGKDLLYAWRDGPGWHHQIVDDSRDVGKYTSLALDAGGYPHVAYYDETYGDLKYAHKDASGWHLEVVDSAGNAGVYTSLALDADRHPHVSYGSATGLGYAYRDPSGWHFEDADTLGGGWSSLALDGAGGVHVSHVFAYMPNPNAVVVGVKYAHRDASGWQVGTVFVRTGDLVWVYNMHCRYSSLCLDRIGRPHIAFRYMYDHEYQWQDHSSVRYCYKDSLGWHETIVEEAAHFLNVGENISLALTSDGVPHISYRRNHLKHAHPTGSGWQREIVDGRGSMGKWTSIALRPDGYPSISHYNECGWNLSYSFKDASGWHLEVADTCPNVGKYTSLAVDPGGAPRISYHDSGNKDLKYAFRDASGWHIERVDSAYHVGNYTSLALDNCGYPRVSYGAGDLKHAYKDATGWHAEKVDSTYNPCYYTSLALDPSGHAHISYGAGGLRHAYEDGSGWQTETVNVVAGGHTSLALDALSRVHISYARGGNLWYALKGVSGWSDETVDAASSVGQWSSLALGPGGYPCISYYDASNGDLRFGYMDNSGWHIEVVDSVGDVGAHTSLALDEYGRPHISYCDATDYDLKYAVGQPSWMYLSGTLQAGQFRLTWNPWPGTSGYWVYGAGNLTYFEPGLSPGYQHRLAVLSPLFQTWSSPNGIGDPNDNWSYLVLAVDAAEQELCRSNRVGEHDFDTGD